ncbi:MAG: FtsX-like permease family protein [Gemmatimonadetes bacterium]|nr:FtsX-like permease family protein [Gemmatimonadota bacterium]
MYLKEGAILALAQIRAQKLKSFFAVLGVIIGVMFLITVVSVVEGMNTYMEEDFASKIYGLNTLTLARQPEVNFSNDPDIWRAYQRRPRLTFADADAVRAQLSMPALVAVESYSGGNIVSEHGVEVTNVWLTGASSDLFRIRELEIERGRAFTAPEDRTGVQVVVLGSEAADKLFGSLDPIGRTVKINQQPFRVVGVLKKQGSLFGMSMDTRAIAPARSAMGRMVNPHGVVDRVLVKPLADGQLEQARSDVEAVMRVRHRLRPTEGNDFAIETAEGSMAFWDRIKKILLVAFPGLVSIALVVGGIVIMNIMLVSVAERTREIGIRKALGARRRDIHIQVLVESATLSLAGAALGIAIGIVGAWLVRALSPLPATISPFWIGVSVLLGAGVGVIAGIYPAAKAARLDPVVALRAE